MALLLREPQIRTALDMPSCIDAMSAAFASYARGEAELPAVIHLDVPDHDGEIHVKAGYIHGRPIYAVKFASGFPSNAALGIPVNGGLVLVFDAATGAPRAFLFDEGCITDIRTGAAGGLAVRHLAPEEIGSVAIIGTGEQSRQQLSALLCERDVGEVRLWGRDAGRTASRAEQLAELHVPVRAVESPESAARDADVIISVTPSREPLIQRDWVRGGATVIAVGSDGPGKQELDPALLRDADLVVADSLVQCRERGELQHAPDLVAVELGAIAAGEADGRSSNEQLIVCDLTGVGVQDVAAAALVLERSRDQAEQLEI